MCPPRGDIAVDADTPVGADALVGAGTLVGPYLLRGAMEKVNNLLISCLIESLVPQTDCLKLIRRVEADDIVGERVKAMTRFRRPDR